MTLDSHRGCVVLALRGTLTMQDLVTDLILDPVPLDSWLPAAFLQVGRSPAHTSRSQQQQEQLEPAGLAQVPPRLDGTQHARMHAGSSGCSGCLPLGSPCMWRLGAHCGTLHPGPGQVLWDPAAVCVQGQQARSKSLW